jgi:hypothetical protein
MTAVTRRLQDQAFEPLECSIPEELTIAEYRSRRAGGVSPRKPERRSPKLSFRSLIRR